MNIIKHSSEMVIDSYTFQKDFHFQRLLKFGIWFVTYQNEIITFGQYRNDLEEWIKIIYKL